MKVTSIHKWAVFLPWLLLTIPSAAQHKLSLDIAGIRSMRNGQNGLNVSSFYHFTEHVTGGVEINRFFPVTRKSEEGESSLSAWDLDLNFHYNIPVSKTWKFYPIAGVSHSSENEYINGKNESKTERFFSFNTGAGILWESGNWLPHVEYLFTWGRMNQQFLLAGVSYEIHLKHKKTGEKKTAY